MTTEDRLITQEARDLVNLIAGARNRPTINFDSRIETSSGNYTVRFTYRHFFNSEVSFEFPTGDINLSVYEAIVLADTVLLTKGFSTLFHYEAFYVVSDNEIYLINPRNLIPLDVQSGGTPIFKS